MFRGDARSYVPSRARSRDDLTQDLVDEPRAAVVERAQALPVLAGQELGDEAEREELDPDDHEEHPEQEQRPVPDGLARHLHDGEVDEDRAADRPEREAEPAEQVQRTCAGTGS